MNPNALNIAGIQSDLTWENPAANRSHFADKIDSLDKETDVVVLPEMFSTGFSMNPQPLAETMNGETIEWMKLMANKTKAVMAGSLIIQEADNYFNRFLWVQPDGNIHYYDKRHLFSLAGEHHEYTSGKSQAIIDYKGWKICLNVCYDLRFPVWSRNTTGYDLLIYVANWPKPRVAAWTTLLRARAIENQSYVVGVNRIGEDANANEYNGQSAMIDMEGNYLTQADNADVIIQTNLSKTDLKEFRDRLPFYKDADRFELK